MQAAVICREIQSRESKQEGHTCTFQEGDADKFHFKYKNPRFYRPRYQICFIGVLLNELFQGEDNCVG